MMRNVVKEALIPWLVLAACAIAAALFGFGFVISAHSQETHDPACVNAVAATEELMSSGYGVVALEPGQHAQFMANYNALPPQSDVVVDRILVAFRVQGQRDEEFHVAFVIKGCVVGEDLIPAEQFLQLLTAAPGDPA